MPVEKRRRKNRGEGFEEELLKELNGLSEDDLLKDEGEESEEERGRERERESKRTRNGDFAAELYEDESDEEESGEEGEREEDEDDEMEGEDESDELQLGDEKRKFSSFLLSHKKVVLLSVAVVLFVMITVVVLELLLPDENATNARKAVRAPAALKAIEPAELRVGGEGKFASGEHVALKEQDVEKRTGRDGRVLAEKREKREVFEEPKKVRTSRKFEFKSEKAFKSAKDVKETGEVKVAGKVSEDVFLTFFRVGSQPAAVRPSTVEKRSKEDEVSKERIPVLGKGVFPPPTAGMGGTGNVNLDKVRVYAVVCDASGQSCFAETNLGRLKQGDVISGGIEVITSITRNEIRTSMRVIGF